MITDDYNNGPRAVRKDYVLWKIQNMQQTTTTTTTTTTDWANWADFDSWSGLESFESGNGFGSTNNTTANTSTTTESWNWAQFNTGFGNSIEFEAKRKKRSAILTLSKDVDLTRLFVRKIPIRNIIPLQFTHVPLFYFSC